MLQKMIKQVSLKVIALSTIVTVLLPIVPAQASIVSWTPSQALANYKKYMPSYKQRELPIVSAYHKKYNGSLGHKVVARAIWYMKNGYMVYNHKKYPLTGQIDCSNFTQLVFKDFGYDITSASWKYNTVGTRVRGVYATKGTGGNRYNIVGLSKMKPGDIVAFWDAKRDHIGHVAIYMGIVNGKPRVIGTSDGRPTAIGIDDLQNSWMGGRIHSVRRLLPSTSTSPTAGAKYKAQRPTIPQKYFLKPQQRVVMPQYLTHGF